MKKITLSLIILLSLQSCFTTRYISKEPQIRSRYMGATIDDVEFDLGVSHTRYMSGDGGYSLIYLTNGRDVEGRPGVRNTRFTFNDKGVVTNVRSDVTVEGRKCNVGLTVLTSIAGIIAVPIIIIKATELYVESKID